MSTFRHASVKLKQTGRKLAYSQTGDVDSPQVLLCLPGLLETRATFAPLLHAARNTRGLRVVSLDYCGRGDSDPLPEDSGYCMSLYLSDTEAFIHQEIWGHGAPRARLDLLGTSMGGILGMYLAAKPDNAVTGLFLNDIGLNLTWMSIYGLYEGMKTAGRVPEADTLAMRLGVTEGAVRDVQSPHHFDLPHHKDWKGMKFGHILHDFHGAVRLIYGSESGVCLPLQVQELQTRFPELAVNRVEGASHPVPFTEAVCAFVLQELKLAPWTVHIELPETETKPAREAMVQSPLPLEESVPTQALPVAAQEVSRPPVPSAPVDELITTGFVAVEMDNNWRSKFSRWLSKFK